MIKDIGFFILMPKIWQDERPVTQNPLPQD